MVRRTCRSLAGLLAALAAQPLSEVLASGGQGPAAVCDRLRELIVAKNDTRWPRGSVKKGDSRAVKFVQAATADKVSQGSASYRTRLRKAHVGLMEWLQRHQPERADVREALMERAVAELGLYRSRWQYNEHFHEDLGREGAAYFPRDLARARWPELTAAVDELEAQVLSVLVEEHDRAVQLPQVRRNADEEGLKERALRAEHEVIVAEQPEGLTLRGSWTIMPMAVDAAKSWQCAKKLFPRTCEVLTAFNEKIRKADSGVITDAWFGTMHPGTKVVAHTSSGNQILKVHCGIHNPDNVQLRVTDFSLTWRQGECFIWDDSFEHELETPAAGRNRTILELQIRHPDLSRHGYFIDERDGRRVPFKRQSSEL